MQIHIVTIPRTLLTRFGEFIAQILVLNHRENKRIKKLSEQDLKITG